MPLQELDLQIDSREKQKSDSIARIADTKKKLDEDSLLLKKKLALLKKIQLRKRDAEGELQTLTDKIGTSKLKMKAAGLSPSSYEALQKEIDSLTEKASDVETRVLEDMEKIELLEKDTQKNTKLIAKRTEQFENMKFAIDKQILALNEEIVNLKTSKNQVSLKIDASLLELYEELRRKKGGQIIYETEVPSCPACGMGFSNGFVTTISRHDGAETCPYCGLLIKWTGYRDE